MYDQMLKKGVEVDVGPEEELNATKEEPRFMQETPAKSSKKIKQQKVLA